jgi:hypothetical protein
MKHEVTDNLHKLNHKFVELHVSFLYVFNYRVE